MSQENVELVRAVYATGGDLEAAIEFFSPDIEWDMSDRVFNPRVYRGHGGGALSGSPGGSRHGRELIGEALSS
jgi:hypothetical protein